MRCPAFAGTTTQIPDVTILNNCFSDTDITKPNDASWEYVIHPKSVISRADRNGPRILDSRVSGIFREFQAANAQPAC